MKRQIYLLIFITSVLNAECTVPKYVAQYITKRGIDRVQKIDLDVKRSRVNMKSLCVFELSIPEKYVVWKMTLVFNPKREVGYFWFLPHDNEDTSFKTAIYSTLKYGGGFLAVEAKEKRIFLGQDPNRNFSTSKIESKSCKKQKYFSPIYTRVVLNIINSFKPKKYPYLTLHNNTNGGGISILNNNKIVSNYPAYTGITKYSKGLRDEDNLVYMAGYDKQPHRENLQRILDTGINVKYEIVSKEHNDCSFSNYVVLSNKGQYYNIESEHGANKIQNLMVDKLLTALKKIP